MNKILQLFIFLLKVNSILSVKLENLWLGSITSVFFFYKNISIKRCGWFCFFNYNTYFADSPKLTVFESS